MLICETCRCMALKVSCFFCVEGGAAATSRLRATVIWIAGCGDKTNDGTLQHTQHRRDRRFLCSWRSCGVAVTKLNGLGSVKNVSSSADEDYWRTFQKVSEKLRDQLSVQSVCFVKGAKIPNVVLWADVIYHGDVRGARLPCFQAGVRCLSKEGINGTTVGSEDQRRPAPSC